MGTTRKWTTEEIDLLREHGPTQELAELLGRTRKAVDSKQRLLSGVEGHKQECVVVGKSGSRQGGYCCVVCPQGERMLYVTIEDVWIHAATVHSRFSQRMPVALKSQVRAGTAPTPRVLGPMAQIWTKRQEEELLREGPTDALAKRLGRSITALAARWETLSGQRRPAPPPQAPVTDATGPTDAAGEVDVSKALQAEAAAGRDPLRLLGEAVLGRYEALKTESGQVQTQLRAAEEELSRCHDERQTLLAERDGLRLRVRNLEEREQRRIDQGAKAAMAVFGEQSLVERG